MRAAALVVLVACGGGAAVDPAPLHVEHAAPPATDTFGDNAMVEFAPANTPYAFASFKPIPFAVFHKLFALNRAMLKKHAAVFGTNPIAHSFVDALESVDPDKLADLGLTPTARLAVYGLGAYPVVRVEVANGDRLLDVVKRGLAATGDTLPEPIMRGKTRHWVVPAGNNVVFVGLRATEVVIAYAPRGVIDANLADLLGEQAPAAHLTRATFRALATRDGFSGQGIGFADLARIVALVDGGEASAACRRAIDGDLARMPRVAFGYDDVTARRMGLGLVVELAPELVAAMHDIETELPGADALMAGRPLLAALVRVDVDKARALGGRVLGELGALAQTCDDQPAVAGLASAAAWLAGPMPPMLDGFRGLYAAFDRVAQVGKGALPSSGFARADYRDTSAVIALANWLPRLGLAADRAPHALPPMFPFPGHVIASATTIALGLGDDSAAKAASALDGNLPGGTGRQPPLALVAMDFSQLGDMLAQSADAADAEQQRAVSAAIGMSVAKIVVDKRGVVATMVMELR